MISQIESAQASLSFTGNITSALSLEEGETVPVKLIGSLGGGFVRVSVKGFTVKAFASSAFTSLTKNETVQMTVSVKNGQIFLSPQIQEFSSMSAPDIFTKLGIPENAGTAALLAFLKKTGVSLDKSNIKKLASILDSVSGDKEEAAFVLGLLTDKKIPFNDLILKRILRSVYGYEKNKDENEKDSNERKEDKPSNFIQNNVSSAQKEKNEDADFEFFKIINHKKGSRLHWLIFPFDKEIDGKLWKGSLAILLDLENSNCKTFSLRCRSGKESWLFSFKDKTCFFIEENGICEEKQKEFALLIEECLKNAGIEGYSVVYGKEKEPCIIPVDILA